MRYVDLMSIVILRLGLPSLKRSESRFKCIEKLWRKTYRISRYLEESKGVNKQVYTYIYIRQMPGFCPDPQ